MKASEIIVLVGQVVALLEKNNIVSEKGELIMPIDSKTLITLLVDIMNLLQSHGVKVSEDVGKLITALPFILPVLLREKH